MLLFSPCSFRWCPLISFVLNSRISSNCMNLVALYLSSSILVAIFCKDYPKRALALGRLLDDATPLRAQIEYCGPPSQINPWMTEGFQPFLAEYWPGLGRCGDEAYLWWVESRIWPLRCRNSQSRVAVVAWTNSMSSPSRRWEKSCSRRHLCVRLDRSYRHTCWSSVHSIRQIRIPPWLPQRSGAFGTTRRPFLQKQHRRFGSGVNHFPPYGFCYRIDHDCPYFCERLEYVPIPISSSSIDFRPSKPLFLLCSFVSCSRTLSPYPVSGSLGLVPPWWSGAMTWHPATV